MIPVEEIATDRWSCPFAADLQRRATLALENGKVLTFPRLGFDLTAGELDLLAAGVDEGSRKNITFDPATGTCRGGRLAEDEYSLVERMLRRFSEISADFVARLLPNYAGRLERARATYRPIEIKGREYSPRKDDRRLHVDAFPSRPTQGQRILRVFTNINRAGESRFWRVGEPFEDFASRYVTKLRAPSRLEAWLLAKAGITRRKRSAYDQIMLQLHDMAKFDQDYQANALHYDLEFPPDTTWICYTDQVLHAALAGRLALEQTFHLNPDVMLEPSRSPLRVLERMTGRTLV
jgi:hypothetical protein